MEGEKYLGASEVKRSNEERKEVYCSHAIRSAQKKLTLPVLQKWFEMIESGEAELVLPSFEGRMFTPPQVNKVINAIDKTFEDELKTNRIYWKQHRQVEHGPEFHRLKSPLAREAMMQDIYQALKEGEQKGLQEFYRTQ